MILSMRRTNPSSCDVLRAATAALVVLTTACGSSAKPEDKQASSSKAQKDKPPKRAVEKLPPLTVDCAQALEPAPAYVPPAVTERDGFRAEATEGPAALSAGPILGDMTASSVSVWIRADRATKWRVSVWPEKQAKKKRVIEGPEPTKEHDYTASVVVGELEPSTSYNYAVEIGEGKAAVKLPEKTFHTFAEAGKPTKLRLVFGSDIGAEPNQPIFAQMAEAKPDLLLLIGDQMYSDQLKPTFAAYANKYERNWNIAQLKDLMQSVPAFMIWDDHDIKDNYYAGSSAKRYDAARLAYELYVQRHNPTPVQAGELHYQFVAGDVAFFVLDTRSHRSNPKLEDGPDKTMLGEAQKQDLARFLKCGASKVKVVVSSVMFSMYATGNDSWNAYDAERDQLIAFLEQEAVDNLVLLSGDQRFTAVIHHVHDKARFYELQATPISKAMGHAPTKNTKDIVARDDDNNVFGVLDIDTTAEPAAFAFTACAKDKACNPGAEHAPSTGLDVEGDQENVPFTVKFTADDLGPKGAAPKQAAPPQAAPPQAAPDKPGAVKQ